MCVWGGGGRLFKERGVIRGGLKHFQEETIVTQFAKIRLITGERNCSYSLF